jgi:class 3 adenylate cyclase/HAMP domain-containing protein
LCHPSAHEIEGAGEEKGAMTLLRLLRRRLRVRAILLIVSILIAGFGLLVILNIQYEAQALVATHQETARLLAASVFTSIETGMLEARPDVIRRLIQSLKLKLPGVRRLRVYRANGVEAFADLDTLNTVTRLATLEPGVVERISEMSREPEEPINDPAFTHAVDTITPQEISESLDGVRILTLFRPLRNQVKCQGCHGDDHQVRGVVRVSLSLEKLDAALHTARNRQLAIATLTILGVVATSVVFLGRVVLKPIDRVAATARRIGSGDFSTRVVIAREDELGDLERVINDMAERLASAYKDLEARNSELAIALQDLRESMQRVEILEQIKVQLAKFVPESVQRLLEQNPDARELEKRDMDVSVLFLDLEGYVRLSEQLPPQRLNRMIQDYFSSFLEIIRGQHGDINETAGDGLMVIFHSEGSPTRHAMNAASAALQLLNKVAELNREFAGVYPPVAIHVGMNSGPALVGATKLDSASGGRWTFTASGTTTNLAARIAELAKGGDVMVGPETAKRIQDAYVLHDTGEHQLKNFSHLIRVYRLVPAGVYRTVDF